MATKMVTKGTTATGHIMAWSIMSGLALALLQCAQTAALPAHIV
ncbi:hypothetical protein [Methylobacterium sp. CM6257]